MKLLDYLPGELEEKLNTYLANDARFKMVFDYTRQRFTEANYLTSHNWAHAYRDILNAIVIGEAENADMTIVLPATAMHDIGFLYGATGKTHGAIGAEKLPEFLRDGDITYTPDEIKTMAACIRTHKGSMHNEKPESLEAKVVADADLMEKFGPIGVYQNIRSFGEFNYTLEVILERDKKMLELTMETPTGQRVAEPGRQFVTDFFKELREATDPYRNKERDHIV
jgi:HD superfamily phosphodiesterase